MINCHTNNLPTKMSPDFVSYTPSPAGKPAWNSPTNLFPFAHWGTSDSEGAPYSWKTSMMIIEKSPPNAFKMCILKAKLEGKAKAKAETDLGPDTPPFLQAGHPPSCRGTSTKYFSSDDQSDNIARIDSKQTQLTSDTEAIVMMKNEKKYLRIDVKIFINLSPSFQNITPKPSLTPATQEPV